MNNIFNNKNLIGINGLGRIGKLTLWGFIANGYFDGAIINVGREVGKKLEDVIQVIESDSTYGSLARFINGHSSNRIDISIVDENEGIIDFDGFIIKILRNDRNPANIKWKENGVSIVVDCTGVFLDPTAPPDEPKGSLRGHLEAGAQKVILSAPFKIKDKTRKMPDDSFMMVYGINHLDFDASKHHILSAASCTTTCLAHMMYPLLQNEETSKIMTASMSTVHAATNSQSVLDLVPKKGASDLRKTRSVLNNIIITSTGAARALEKIITEIKEIGFMADSVRIPTNTVSLIILNLTFSSQVDDKGEPLINKDFLNNIYNTASKGYQKDLLIFSEKQNVSADMIGNPAAAVIEGHETHTRTGFINLPETAMSSIGIKVDKDLNLPVTHAKIFGWYDNEFGYVSCLEKLTDYIDKNMR